MLNSKKISYVYGLNTFNQKQDENVQKYTFGVAEGTYSFWTMWNPC